MCDDRDVESLRRFRELTDRIESKLPVADAVVALGELVDFARALGADQISAAIGVGEALALRVKSPALLAHTHYCIGTAWLDIREIRENHGASRWDWEQPERRDALRHLRKSAVCAETASDLRPEAANSIQTNLANTYSTVGRFVEAIGAYTKVVRSEPSFGMALANRGVALWHYARADYDPGHTRWLAWFALRDLEAGLSAGIEPHAIGDFTARERHIESYIGPDWAARDLIHEAEEFSLGQTDAEVEYRRWCLHNCLYLNTLNDIGPLPIAAADTLHTPSMVVSVDQSWPMYYAFFNQLKLEFVACRYLLYQSLTDTAPSFLHTDIMLFETLDYAVLSHEQELLRIAFRMAYGLLDKVAHFLNHYLGLGRPADRVAFRNVWYTDGEQKKGLLTCLQERTNWPLRGLYWLSQDLASAPGDPKEAIEPDAADLVVIRNFLEHRFLQTQTVSLPPSGDSEAPDGFAMCVGEMDLQDKTLRLLKTARASLIYLSLAVHAEEKTKRASQPPGSIIPVMPLRVRDEQNG